MRRVVLAALLATSLLLAGCTAPSALDSLPAPIQGTVQVRAGTLVALEHPVANTTVPIRLGLAPEPERPGVPFRVLPHRPGDRSLLVAWVDSGTRGCGAVSRIWLHETTMQIVLTLYEMPMLAGAEGSGCPQQGVIHVQRVPLVEPIADRTTDAFRGIGAFGAF